MALASVLQNMPLQDLTALNGLTTFDRHLVLKVRTASLLSRRPAGRLVACHPRSWCGSDPLLWCIARCQNLPRLPSVLAFSSAVSFGGVFPGDVELRDLPLVTAVKLSNGTVTANRLTIAQMPLLSEVSVRSARTHNALVARER